ncbi:hypothetical protein [Bacillus sp. FJAT-47783]|uniref:SGNH/GDSL hydrolase family protein n=1 Tax=Bacillus sp. FJAT-47783 TaxID=2922712 RepID=UPI001FAC9389|nr:hypothetical protein [Bacillus sp. FJAT-47783]
MQKVAAIISCIAVICVVILGEWYWSEKMSHPAEATNTSLHEEEQASAIDLTSVNHLPHELVEKAEKAIENEEPLHFVIYGSESTSTDENAWPSQLKRELQSIYGDLFTFTIFSDESKTTLDVVTENLHQKVMDSNPDILLFEPFILKDNGGLIGINHTLENISTILADIESENEDATIYLQAAHPIFSSKHYPAQVKDLEKYSKENNYHFLDHWAAWTEQDDSIYLVENKDKPNEKGNEVWASYLVNYFVNNE